MIRFVKIQEKVEVIRKEKSDIMKHLEKILKFQYNKKYGKTKME